MEFKKLYLKDVDWGRWFRVRMEGFGLGLIEINLEVILNK